MGFRFYTPKMLFVFIHLSDRLRKCKVVDSHNARARVERPSTFALENAGAGALVTGPSRVQSRNVGITYFAKRSSERITM
jgi:hypothetical protein